MDIASFPIGVKIKVARYVATEVRLRSWYDVEEKR